MGGSSAPFSPASISGLRSRLLDANTFTSPIDSKYYLADSSTTNTHLPRQGRCWLFDGSDDNATSTAADLKLISSNAAFTICGWIKATSPVPAGGIATTWNGSLGFSCYYRNDLLRVYKDSEIKSFATTLVGGTWYHLTYVLDGVSVTAYINGVSIGASQSFANATISSGGSFFVGQSSSVATVPSSSIRDVCIYNVAKTAGEVAAIYEQSRTGSGTFDTTGLLAAYPCNEESGTTGYDISGNGNHLTLTNITQATFHASDTGVLTNPNNAEGYRLSGSVYIPKRLSDSLAADGNALTVSGRAAYHGCAEPPCVTGNGSNVYVNLGSALIPASADFDFEFDYYRGSNGITSYLLDQNSSGRVFIDSTNRVGVYNSSAYYYTANNTVVANTWHKIRVARVGSDITTYVTVNGATQTGSSTAGTFSTAANTKLLTLVGIYDSGRVSNFKITTGGATTYFPLQDGPGSSNTNRDIAWVKSDGTGGVISNAIVNGTVSTIWGNRVPGNVEDWCVKYGGRIAANGAFVAGMLAGGNAADGSAKTLTAGKFGNPFSRLNLNPATAAELNGRSVPTAAVVADDINATITPTQSAFRRSKTDGDDRFLIYDDTLSGADLTNVEGYVA